MCNKGMYKNSKKTRVCVYLDLLFGLIGKCYKRDRNVSDSRFDLVLTDKWQL